jgi:hypothetical protein
MNPGKAGGFKNRLKEEFQLLDSFVFLFLFSDVLTNHLFISANGRNKVSTRPEALTGSPSCSTLDLTSYMDCALSFHKANYLRD